MKLFLLKCYVIVFKRFKINKSHLYQIYFLLNKCDLFFKPFMEGCTSLAWDSSSVNNNREIEDKSVLCVVLILVRF